jgi:hypothetical protein
MKRRLLGDAMTRVAILAALVAVLMPLAACEDTSPDPEEREEVLTAVRGYLDALASAYSELDETRLEEWASPNEIAAIRKLIHGLIQTRDRVDSTMRGFEVEHMEIFRQINATVRLIEVWDVVRYDATTGVQKGRTPDSIQYTLLQLRKVDDRWIVVGRSVLQRETPVAETAGEAPE